MAFVALAIHMLHMGTGIVLQMMRQRVNEELKFAGESLQKK
jgi:hypothetical protein